jgi:uncharacterized membrane protein
MESHFRSLAKAISYRVLASTGTILVFFLFSRDVALSVGAGTVDCLLKIAFYFLHERLGNHVPFGRSKRPEYETANASPSRSQRSWGLSTGDNA